jgi:hypothetical protein
VTPSRTDPAFCRGYGRRFIRQTLAVEAGQKTNTNWKLPVYATDFLLGHPDVLVEVRGQLTRFHAQFTKARLDPPAPAIAQCILLLLIAAERMSPSASFREKFVAVGCICIFEITHRGFLNFLQYHIS